MVQLLAATKKMVVITAMLLDRQLEMVSHMICHVSTLDFFI